MKEKREASTTFSSEQKQTMLCVAKLEGLVIKQLQQQVIDKHTSITGLKYKSLSIYDSYGEVG